MKIFWQLTLATFLALMVLETKAEEQIPDVEPFSQAELEQILAPIALYPDTVLSHILIAATYPLEVIQAERWTQKNTDITGSDAVELVENENWDPSVKALVAFPQVLKRLSENLEWTQKLGDAFLQDEEKLLASVQSLRVRAYEAGNLDKMDKVSVVHENDSIVIEPVEREVVYVPYYDTRFVYGPWHWSHYPPVYWNSPHYASHYYGHHVTPFYWGPSVHVSFGFFFSSFHWNNHHVVRIPYNHYQPHHYYDRHQIARHQHAARWTHNPTHRRGVSYRSVTVSNRYRSTRPSQAEVQTHRTTRNLSKKDVKTNRNIDRVVAKKANRKEVVRTNSADTRNNSNTRIATPDRIKKELSDGRISVKERKNRPTNYNPAKQTKSSKKQVRSKNTTTQPRPKKETTKSNQSKERKKQTNYRQSPPKQQVQGQSSTRENNSRSSSQSSSRSSDKSSSQRSSGGKSSGSSRSNRSKSGRERKH